MREILFRGKCKETKVWYTGYYINLHRTTHCFKEDYDNDKNNDIHQIVFESMTDWGLPNRHLRVDIIPETVGQYTGSTDKNGTKIFEGDIVRIAYCFGWDYEQEKNVPEEEYVSKVYSIDACPFCVDLQHCDSDMMPIAWLDWEYDDVEIEVIGNIHDNPELLKECEGK